MHTTFAKEKEENNSPNIKKMLIRKNTPQLSRFWKNKCDINAKK